MASDQDLELRQAFFNESEEILDRLSADITTLEGDTSKSETVDAIFRGLHTIKGNSSFLSLERITKLSHVAETLLDKIRKKQMAVTLDILEVLKLVSDELKAMIVDQEVDKDVTHLIEIIEDLNAGKKPRRAIEKKDSAPAGGAPAAKMVATSYIKMEEKKIGKILSLVSELELLRYSFERVPEKMEGLTGKHADLRFDVDMQVGKLSRMVRTLSGIMFGVRLVPVNKVFQRFPAVVKELASKLNKKIELVVLNGNAELDKSIVEAITDPMTHLIRNSCDHGVEMPDVREKSGKNPVGKIKLNSFVKGNFVYIEIIDDGKGIDGDMILRKAVEKGIVPKEKVDSFTESQKLALIFAPGFSTAEKVTDISGRGVGMDVVKSNINKLKGTVIINSKPGAGTTIQLRFPISMVVLFSLFVQINQTICAIAVEEIEESVDFYHNDLMNQPPTDTKPEDVIALYSLRELLWDDKTLPDNNRIVHVLRFKDNKNVGFIVDEYFSLEEAIVQSVDSYIAAMPGIQGASVRKDGSVAIMLNTESLFELSKKAKPYAYAKINQNKEGEFAGLYEFMGITGTG